MIAIPILLLAIAVPHTSAELVALGTITEASQFNQGEGIGQDNGMAFSRDAAGTLWGVLGNTAHSPGVSIFSGTSVDNMTRQYVAAYNFKVGSPATPSDGAAGTAFDGIPYPDGPQSRGALWPMGLYIQPSGRFICYIHNETGWFAGGTGYTTTGPGDHEPDFRHIGAMYSDDQGRTWNFAGWVITAHEPSWTTAYQPDGMTGGQDPSSCILGAGDFGVIDNTNRDGYVYIVYSKGYAQCVARANPNTDPFTWTKYYNGNWDQPGNGGLETYVNAINAGEPAIAYAIDLKKFIMVSFDSTAFADGNGGADVQIQSSPDLISWSRPELFLNSENCAYFGICDPGGAGPVADVHEGFRLLFNKWGSPIHQADVVIREPGDGLASSQSIALSISPNPCKGVMDMWYKIPVDAGTVPVHFVVYDARGCVVKNVVDGVQSPGTYATHWNAGNVPSGVYILRLKAGKRAVVRKALVVK